MGIILHKGGSRFVLCGGVLSGFIRWIALHSEVTRMFVLRWALSGCTRYYVLPCVWFGTAGRKGYFSGTVDRLRYFLVPLQALCGRRGGTCIIQHR